MYRNFTFLCRGIPPIAVFLSICHRKRRIALLLCALFLFQAAGWQLAWFAARADAREQARHYVKRRVGQLLTLTVAADELEAMRVGKKEIRFQNGLYDIHTETRIADSVQISVYRDTLEEALVGTLHVLLSAGKNGPEQAPLNVLIAQWIGLAYLAPENPVWAFYAPQEPADDVFVAAAYHCAGFAMRFSPPPEV